MNQKLHILGEETVAQVGAAKCVCAVAKKTAAQKPIRGDLLLLFIITANMCQALGWNPVSKLLAVQPWARYLTTLCLSFLICKMVPTSES